MRIIRERNAIIQKSRQNKIILIAGLTASGKSQLALDIAASLRQRGGDSSCGNAVPAGEAVIINADSMQVYEGLSILTARPQKADLAQAQHYLYGFVAPACRFSVGAWLKAVENLLQQPQLADKTLIFVGGTGLYFHALLHGLAETPPIGSAVRQKGEILLSKQGLPALYADLAEHDPLMAAKLHPQDRLRIVRAWEVWQQTGKSLEYWHKQKTQNTLPHLLRQAMQANKLQKIALLPPRELIYARINARVDKMVEQNVLAEVEVLRKYRLDPQLPIMKASGLPAFCAYLDGKMDLSAAIEKAKQETRHYAKRQRTWFSRQLSSDWQVVASPENAMQYFP